MIRTIANSTACLLMITDRSSLGLNYIYMMMIMNDDDHDMIILDIGAVWRIEEIDCDDNDCMMRNYVSAFLMMIVVMMSIMVAMMIMVILSTMMIISP